MHAFVLAGAKLSETQKLADVAEAYAAGATVWLDVGPDDEGERTALDRFFEKTLELHLLTIEDLWAERALPKIEDFGRYLFVLAHGVRHDDKRRICTLELDVVTGPRFVVTHHEGSSRSVDAVRAELQRSPRLLEKGTAWVLHALLDHLVDHYVPVFDDLDEIVEALEHDVIAKAGTRSGHGLMTRIFELKRELQHLRRIVAHQRETLVRLSRGEFDAIPKEAVPFFRDVYDHFSRVTSLAESYRELLSSVLESYLSVQSNRMNEVMKALTLLSTVMLPLTVIAGVYGMNFDVMPELKWRFGYLWALGLMAAVTLGILVWFRHKRWL